jgi:tetratricopeptide (TPR) repeat protein
MQPARQAHTETSFGRRPTPAVRKPGYPRECMPETIAGRTLDSIYAATGVLEYNAGNLHEAVRCFRYALMENRNNHLALMYVGIMERDFGFHEKAMRMFTRSIEACGDNAQAYVERALIHVKENSLKAAGADLVKALELDPNYAQAYLWLGQCKSQEGCHRDAVLLLTKYCELAPDDIRNRNAIMAYKETALKIVKPGRPSVVGICRFVPRMTLDGSVAFLIKQAFIQVQHVQE